MGFTVPADQVITPKYPTWGLFPVFGQIAYFGDRLSGQKKEQVSFDVVYNGVREKLECEVLTDKDTWMVTVYGCEPAFGAKAWPKGLAIDDREGYGALFSNRPHGNHLTDYMLVIH